MKAECKDMEDGAIVGCVPGSEGVWTAGSTMGVITADEIKRLVSSDRTTLFTNGVTLGGVKCRLVNDLLFAEDATMSLVTKESSQAIYAGKSKQALIFIKGFKSVHAGQLSGTVSKYVKCLSESGY
ncbi:unnamed protein product [Merluccius merluccius]